MGFEYKKLSLKTRTFYGLGSFGINLTTGLFVAWTLIFYIKMIGLDPLLWGFSWLVYLIWNAVNDPLFGLLSDRTHTKYGRRVPYLMVGGPLLSLSFILLYATPTISEQWVYFVWLLTTLIIYDSFFTIIGLNFNSLMAELTIDPDERAKLNLFAGVGSGFGISITYLLPILFIDFDAVPFSQNLPAFYYIVLILAIFGAILLAFTAFGIKERPEFLPEKSEKLSIWYCTKKTLKNKSFLTFVIFNFMMTYVVFAIQSNLPFYMADVLRVSSDNILGSTPLLMFIIFSIFGYPVGLYLNKRKGNKRALFYLSIIVVFGFVLVTFSNDALFVNISFMIIGFGYSGQTLLVFTLLADIIDKDELDTGQRREGAFFGINALVTKPAQSVSAMISGFIFAFTNFNQDLGVGETQPASAILGIKLLIGLIPAIFIVVGLISLWYYPLDGISKEYKEMKRQVGILHIEKIDRLKEKLSSSKNNK